MFKLGRSCPPAYCFGLRTYGDMEEGAHLPQAGQDIVAAQSDRENA